MMITVNEPIFVPPAPPRIYRRAIPMVEQKLLDNITVEDAQRMWVLGYDSVIKDGRIIDFERAPLGSAGRVIKPNGSLYEGLRY